MKVINSKIIKVIEKDIHIEGIFHLKDEVDVSEMIKVYKKKEV